MIKFFVGLDLGQSQDYTALSILERLKNDKECVYHVRHLERIRGAPYPSIVEKTARIMQSPGLKGCASLVVDQTGVGAPVIDLFQQEGLEPVGVLIHGGDKASHEGAKLESSEKGSGWSSAGAPADRAAQGGGKAQAGAGPFAGDAELQG